ncbi:hypothetical protein ACFLIN_05630 [Corynebacterium kutscheri]|uniref:Uncharacterized protein n=1 Tax=Corynebacterium kutscheri TaxID=35755 RepID=A0A0F6QYZ7_9CORY|nr:hypothetical protein [Corynebacterium kutscheri]AKE40430.1 hypothetical protein UL82_00985 [Corynebacterium kutscheri]
MMRYLVVAHVGGAADHLHPTKPQVLAHFLTVKNPQITFLKMLLRRPRSSVSRLATKEQKTFADYPKMQVSGKEKGRIHEEF